MTESQQAVLNAAEKYVEWLASKDADTALDFEAVDGLVSAVARMQSAVEPVDCYTYRRGHEGMGPLCDNCAAGNPSKCRWAEREAEQYRPTGGGRQSSPETAARRLLVTPPNPPPLFKNQSLAWADGYQRGYSERNAVEVAAKPVAWTSREAFDVWMNGRRPWAGNIYDELGDPAWDRVPLYTAPLVAEREVLRELVRLWEAHAITLSVDADGDTIRKIVKAWSAARALLRNTPEAVSTNAAAHPTAEASIDGGNMG